MFIVKSIKAEEATGELKLIYKKIQKTLGFIPPHFELFATIDSKSLMDFIEYNLYFKTHPNINEKFYHFYDFALLKKSVESIA